MLSNLTEVLWQHVFSFLLVTHPSSPLSSSTSEEWEWGWDSGSDYCPARGRDTVFFNDVLFSSRRLQQSISTWTVLRRVSSSFYRIASSRVVLSFLDFVLETDKNGQWPIERFQCIRDLLLKRRKSVAGGTPSFSSLHVPSPLPSVALTFLLDPEEFPAGNNVLPENILRILLELLKAGCVRTLTFGCMTLSEDMFSSLGTEEAEEAEEAEEKEKKCVTVFPQVQVVNIFFCDVRVPTDVSNQRQRTGGTLPEKFRFSFLSHFPKLETLNILGPSTSEQEILEGEETYYALLPPEARQFPVIDVAAVPFPPPRPKSLQIESHDAFDLLMYHSPVFCDFSRLVSVTLCECSISLGTLTLFSSCYCIEEIFLRSGCFIEGSTPSETGTMLDVDFSGLLNLRRLELLVSPLQVSTYFLEHCLPPQLQELHIRDYSPVPTYLRFLENLFWKTRLPPDLKRLAVQCCPVLGRGQEQHGTDYNALNLWNQEVDSSPCAVTSLQVEFPYPIHPTPDSDWPLISALRNVPRRFHKLHQLALKGLCSELLDVLWVSPSWSQHIERLNLEWSDLGNAGSFESFVRCFKKLKSCKLEGFSLPPERVMSGSFSCFAPGLTHLDIGCSIELTDDTLAFLLSSVKETVLRLHIQNCPKLTLRSMELFATLSNVQEIYVDSPEQFPVGHIGHFDQQKVLLPASMSLPGLFRKTDRYPASEVLSLF